MPFRELPPQILTIFTKYAASPRLDVLVAFADTIWKGQRDEVLERELAQQIGRRCQRETWQVYMQLDDMACELAKGAHERILWQAKHGL
ncbi:MAG: hypothetical protein M3Z08_04930 [Chloroflexota bacterium]|nr:hypothetical protein [Chloroflexota bacterium]